MKIARPIHPPTRQINEAAARFTHVNMDNVIPLPAINKSPFRYLVTFIDHSRNLIEAHPVHYITAEEVCHAFLLSWFSSFGVPLYITTDRGTQFESQLIAQLSQTPGFCRLRATSYHPQSNGKVERFHRTLKAALMSSKTDLIAALPVFPFGLSSFESQLIAQLSQTPGFCRLRATSYHPQSNGKVERFHRTLKAALMSSKTDLIAALPVFPFGLSSKPDINLIPP